MVYDLLELHHIENPQPRMCDEGHMEDYDGNKYKTVIIGHQCWTAENLRVRHFNNGDPIQLGKNLDDFSIMYEMSQPGYCHYNFDDQQLNYGLFYNGYAIYDSRGLVPPGWRLPTLNDFERLKDNINKHAIALSLGPEIYCAGEPSDDNPGLNLSGFGSLPGGEYSYRRKSPWGYPKWHLGITCLRLEEDYSRTSESAFYWLEDAKELRVMVVSELTLKSGLSDPLSFCSVRLVRDLEVKD